MASSDHTVPGITVVMIASAARPFGSRITSGIRTKAERGPPRLNIDPSQATSKFDLTTSYPTRSVRRNATVNRLRRTGDGRSGALQIGPTTPMIAAISRLPGLSEWLSSSHRPHIDRARYGDGKSPLIEPLQPPDVRSAPVAWQVPT